MHTQLKEQERIADTAASLAALLWDLSLAQDNVLVVATPTKQANLIQQGSSTKTLVSDLATLLQDILSHTPTRTSKATLSLLTADSVSGVSSFTTPAFDQNSDLNASNYSSVPHNYLLENKVDDTLGTNMFSMSHRTVPGCRGHFWFLQANINYLSSQDSKNYHATGSICSDGYFI